MYFDNSVHVVKMEKQNPWNTGQCDNGKFISSRR